MTVWTEPVEAQPATPPEGHAVKNNPIPPESVQPTPAISVPQTKAPTPRYSEFGWLMPSSLETTPEEARAAMVLPNFDELILEKARVISGRYPFAEAEYRNLRDKEPSSEREIAHFEKVFRIAADLASIPNVREAADYDELLILTAWHSVKPGVEGFLGSYPKSLLCPLSHSAPPTALASLTSAKQRIFERRAPTYLRYLLCEKFGLRTCSDIENADLRHLLRNAGFRLVRSSAVPEFAFPGLTRGEDPPVRPWKLTLRQELSDDRAAEMLVVAALWQIKYG